MVDVDNGMPTPPESEDAKLRTRKRRETPGTETDSAEEAAE
jgi:hypothetical protein